jgi:hypothetical protein
MPGEFITDSEFHMWRAVFAFAFVDKVFSIEEQEFLSTRIRSVNFSDKQRNILKEDLTSPPNIEAMYGRITQREDRERFCALARALVWSEGDMEEQERVILGRVGCMKSEEGMETLRSSRTHPSLQEYHEYYEKAGMAGLFDKNPRFEIRV